MSRQFSTTPETSIRVCPVAKMLEKHCKSFGPAASDAMTIAQDLDDALYGLDKDLTPADLKAADLESLEVTADNLEDLLEQAQEALLTIQRIIELRMNPDARWQA